MPGRTQPRTVRVRRGTESLAGHADQAVREAALAAHARLVAHLERTAADGDPDPALGGPRSAR